MTLRLSAKAVEKPFITLHGETHEGYVGLKTDLSLVLLVFFIFLAFCFRRSKPLLSRELSRGLPNIGLSENPVHTALFCVLSSINAIF